MRVLVDFHAVTGIYQGSTQHLKAVYSRLVVSRKNWYFHFIVPQDLIVESMPELAFMRAENVTLHRVKQVGAIRRHLAQIPYFAIKTKAQVIHTQYICALVPVGQKIVTIHDVLPLTHGRFFSLKSRLMHRFAMKCNRHFACSVATVSEFSRLNLLELFGKKWTGSVLNVGNGVARINSNPRVCFSGDLQKYGLKEKKFLLCVGRVDQRRTHIDLLKSLSGVIDKDFPIVFVGSENNANYEAAKLLKRLAKGGSVIWLQNVPNSELSSLYMAAFCSIYPSLAEGFGMPIIESYEHFCPCLHYSNTAQVEFAIEDIRLNNDLSNLQPLLKELSNQEFRERVIRSGREISGQYDWQDVSKRYENLFAKITT